MKSTNETCQPVVYYLEMATNKKYISLEIGYIAQLLLLEIREVTHKQTYVCTHVKTQRLEKYQERKENYLVNILFEPYLHTKFCHKPNIFNFSGRKQEKHPFLSKTRQEKYFCVRDIFVFKIVFIGFLCFCMSKERSE